MNYKKAIAWIAKNDTGMMPTSRDELDTDTVYQYRTVALVADLYNYDRRIVATDVVRERVKLKK